MPDLDDENFSPEELAEAEELARVLAGGALKSKPSAALEAAAMLQVAHKPVLDETRFRKLRSELPRVQPSSEGVNAGGFFSMAGLRQVAFRLSWLLVPVAVALFVGVRSMTTSSKPAQQTSEVQLPNLPKPSLELLRAQAAALQGNKDGEYDRYMSAYRGQVLAVLEVRASRRGRF